jgi:DNA-binding MarR family transcriptional regulator
LLISLLYVVEEADFVFLKHQTDLTDGNISSHLSKLEDAGYVSIEKKTKGKKSQTLYSLTKEGRIAFDNYRKKMSKVLGNLTK